MMLYPKNFTSLQNLLFNQSNDTTTQQPYVNYVASFQSNRIKFIIFFILQVLTIPCFLNAFYKYISQQRLRKSLSYDVIFLLLFISFLFVTIALSLTQAYMFTSYVYPSTEIFCSLWNWFHYSLNIINLFLMAFISIERNLLIFKPNILRTKRGKYIFHYYPIIFCLIYPPLFYIGAIFICPCINTYKYDQLLCTWPCYFGNIILANIDLFFNNYTPLIIIPLFCISIYIRVLYQKRLMRLQIIKWRRDKKLILQLLIISSLYLSMWMPLQICGLINIYWDSAFLVQAQIDYMYLFPYIIHLIYPFIVLFIIHHKNGTVNQHVVAIQLNNAPLK